MAPDVEPIDPMPNPFAWLFLTLAPLSATQAPAGPGPQAEAPAALVTDRIAILGASLTEGFGLESEIGAPIWMGDVLRAAFKKEVPAPRRGSSLDFFADPRGVGAKSAAEALAENPTLVLGLDYLFWFGYGEFATPQKRRESFEFGLAQLAAFRCPVLVGDLPDMSAALTGNPQVLQPGQIPDKATLGALNERLRAWDKEHPNVIVFALSELNTKLRSGKELALRGNTIFASELPDLFQSDQLHPKVMGTIVIWIAALDALVRARREIPASLFEWDRQELYRRLYAGQEPVRREKLIQRQKQYEKEHPPPPPPTPEDQARQREAERKKRGGG